METKYYTPYELEKGVNYFLRDESNNVKWYISNNSEKGIQAKAGFCINANTDYNDPNCSAEKSAQFYSLYFKKGADHAYSNILKPVFRKLTTDEEIWFRHCKAIGKFVPYDSVIKNPLIILKEFPESGVCWEPTLDLLTYLQNRKSTINGHSIKAIQLVNRGLAWNKSGIWTVQITSNRPLYTIKQLEPFIIPEHVKHYPLTPEECSFPEKWSLNITLENKHLVRRFLYLKKDEYRGYTSKWIPEEGSTFFYPQHAENAYCVKGEYHKEIDYCFITNEQFKKHVLTHTDKQQQINETSKTQKDERSKRERSDSKSCKIQRFNLIVRDTGSIRATGIRCPKIKVKIGSGYLPD